MASTCPPIFALTAEALEGDKQRFLGLGFDGYLSKPLEAKTLQTMLKSVKSAQAVPGTEVSKAPASSQASQTKPVNPIDDNALLKLMEYGEDNRTRLIELFTTSAPASIAEMRHALEEANTAGLSLAAHTLKGSCSNFGAAPLRELCVQIEEAGPGGPSDLTANLVTAAENELDRVIQALTSYLQPHSPPMKILIAEDDPVAAEILQMALESFGHDVTRASNGLEAWAAFDREPVRLIVSDWFMPGLDGMGLCKKSVNARRRPIPILSCSPHRRRNPRITIWPRLQAWTIF